MKLNVDMDASSPVTKGMQLAVLGMQEVNEDTFDEFFIRMCMYHRAFNLDMAYPTPGKAWRAFIGTKNPRVIPEDIDDWWNRMGECLQFDLLHKHSMDYEQSFFNGGETVDHE